MASERADQQAGLGLVAVDAVGRLQLTVAKTGRVGNFGNVGFGLAAQSNRTFSWAVYPLRSRDYFDFMNVVRADHVQPRTIPGAGMWMDFGRINGYNSTWLARYVRNLGVKMVVIPGPRAAPWLGEDGNWYYGLRWHCQVIDFDRANAPAGCRNFTAYLRTLKAACTKLKAIDPEIACLGPFETALSPDNAPGDMRPKWPDSTVEQPDGTPAGFNFIYQNPATKGHQFIYYPHANNSYEQFVRSRVLRAGIEIAGMDGIYWVSQRSR